MFQTALIISLCLVGILFLIVAIPKRNQALPDLWTYFLYGGTLRLRWFVTSISATNLSYGNFIVPWAILGLTYGWPALILSLIVHIFIIIGYVTFSPVLASYIDSDTSCGSVHEFLAKQHTRSLKSSQAVNLRLSAAVPTILGLLFTLTLELYLGAKLLSTFTSYPFSIAFIALTVLITVYSAWAGYKAVVGTDTVQLIFFFFAFLLAFYATASFDFSAAGAQGLGWHSLFTDPVIPDIATTLSFLVLAFGWLIVAMDVWQRNEATKNHNISWSGNVSGMIVIFLVSLGFVLLGLFDRAILTSVIEVQNGSPVDPITDLITYGMQLPQVHLQIIFGIFAGALVTAALSTADTFLIVCSHTIMADYFIGSRRKTNYTALPQDESRTLTVFGRVIVILLGLLVVPLGLIAETLGLLQDPYTVFFIAYGVQFSLLAPLIFGALLKLRNPVAATISIILSVFISVSYSIILLVMVVNGTESVFGIDNYLLIYAMPAVSITLGFITYPIARFIFRRHNVHDII